MSSENPARCSQQIGEEHAGEIVRLSGLSYRSVPVELRERFSTDRHTHGSILDDLLAHPGISEAVVISTCNRFELVMAESPAERESISPYLENVLERRSGLSSSLFSKSVYHLLEKEAVAHLFRVASGLDSMIVGEPQVLGQIKSAYQEAQHKRATRCLLNHLFQHAFGVAKVVRTRTKIGHNAVSVCYAARELARQIFGDLNGATVMLIGAGDTGALALKHFKSAGVKRFFIANKTLSRATDLADAVGAAVVDLSNFGSLLSQADIVIGACALPGDHSPLLEKEEVVASLHERRGEPQFFIDLGVPRNFAADVGSVSDAFLYDIDDLKGVVEHNLDSRSLELKRAELLVDEEVQKFLLWQETRAVEPSIREVQERFQRYRDEELEKTMRRLKRQGFSAEQFADLQLALGDFSSSLLAKAMHQPFRELKTQSRGDSQILEVFRRLFLGEKNRR